MVRVGFRVMVRVGVRVMVRVSFSQINFAFVLLIRRKLK